MKLKASPSNPRTITDAKRSVLRKQLAEFGDLGGIVFNRRTGELVAGHQRAKEFEKAKASIEIVTQHATATKSGTVAEGTITLDGERFSYREVDWPEEKAKAGLLAANNHAGKWDDDKLTELLKEIGDESKALTGFDSKFLKEASALADAETADGLENDETDNTPRERQVYIVPIALTLKEWKQWEKVKDRVGMKSCKGAFLKLIGESK